MVLAAIVLPFLLAVGWFGYQILTPTDPGRAITFEVRKGWGVSDIGDELESRGVVGSSLAFQVWATVTRAGPFAAGQYRLHEDEGVRGAIRILEAGPPHGDDLKLLLRPGLTIDQVAERVGKLPGHDKDKFLAVAKSNKVRSRYQPAEVTSLEGFLFPDTYFIGAKESDLSIVRKLVSRFDEIADRVGLNKATRVSAYQTVVVASLVEKEAKLAEDAAPIAAVVYNRLQANMQLQIDATLCYVKGGCPPPPTDADKAIESPYNTYKVTDLPPTPIAGVTEASLKAALNPADVPYLYYVIADASGKHAFATTLEEHNRNVEAARAKGLL